MSPAVFFQYVMPHRFFSRLAYYVAKSENTAFKNWLIALVVRKFNVNMQEAENSDMLSYKSFNHFFTRALKPGARTADANANSLLMPADGKVSQVGRITGHDIFQAKGHSFTVAELLGDEADAQAFKEGWFANIYLSPRDYHRVHMPWSGTLTHTVHVPGRLFTVAPWGVKAIPRLFARNERLVCHFDTDHGPMCLVMVGALLVSGVETVWSGVEIPKYASRIQRKDYRGKNIRLERFAEMARFNYGSTVICLWQKDRVALNAFATETPTVLGQTLGNIVS
jgi:phosphatidylserine decarboxylase